MFCLRYYKMRGTYIYFEKGIAPYTPDVKSDDFEIANDIFDESDLLFYNIPLHVTVYL